MKTEAKFEDAESYSYNFSKEKLSFKDIVLLHLKKIGDYASVEFRGGFWQPKIINVGQGQKITDHFYVPDSREIYSNAVEYFADILFPYFDQEMKEAFDKAENELNEAFNDHTIEKEQTREEETHNEAKKHRVFGGDTFKVSYRNIRVEINRRLFRALCCFLYRKKYLELGTIQD
jgi:hypothetical protein